MDIEEIKRILKDYDGPDMNIMEVCGSHTEAVAKYGIPSLLSPKLHLLSGPGCPVCVTTSSYIDRLIALSLEENTCVVTFGDLIRVPGSKKSLSQAKGEGARVEMVYSPMDILSLAEKEPETTFVFAAVGFETTTPVYAMLMETVCGVTENVSGAARMERAQSGKYQNIRLLTSIKTMPEVIDHLMKNGAPIDGFLAPGHVSVVTGSRVYETIAERYRIPFGVSGFRAEELLVAIYGIVSHRGQGIV
ncbi:MAG: hydrogenase formation protein HypD, partial [Lachnospiraceae bacterium]|nr:hydrogenase formation protein HypD [Lachnospiraceae bacterium]